MALLKIFSIFAFCVAQWYNCDGSAIVEFKDEKGLHSGITSKELIFVAFTAPWCSHCRAALPAIEHAYKNIKGENLKDRVEFAKVNCESHQALCVKNKVTGYPTMRLYVKGKMLEDYMGARTADAIVSYVETVAKTGKAMFGDKYTGKQQPMCMAKDYRKYVSHKS